MHKLKKNRFLENISTILLEISVLPLIIIPTIVTIEKINIYYLIVLFIALVLVVLVVIAFKNSKVFDRLFGFNVFIKSTIIIEKDKIGYF